MTQPLLRDARQVSMLQMYKSANRILVVSPKYDEWTFTLLPVRWLKILEILFYSNYLLKQLLFIEAELLEKTRI